MLSTHLIKRTPHLLCLALLLLATGCSRQDLTRATFKDYGDMESKYHLTPDKYSALVKPDEQVQEKIAQWRAENAETGQDYQLGSGDVVRISIFGVNLGLAGDQGNGGTIEATVNEAGDVRLPVVGDVQVQGMTVEQAQKALDEKYATHFRAEPTVRVDVLNYGSRPVFVTGAVVTPGTQHLAPGRNDLLSVLSAAGWMTPEAGDTVIILRSPDAQNAQGRSLRIPLSELIDRGNMDMNIGVQANDVVNVVPRQQQYINVIGYVNRPLAIELPRQTERIPMMVALAQAGGLNRFARAERSVLIRTEGEEQKAYAVDLITVMNKDMPMWLRTGDTLVVGSAWDARFMEIVGTLMGGVSTVRTAAAP